MEREAKPFVTSEPLACISDVHGNLAALNAVLERLEERSVKDIIVAGDILLGGEHPLEVFRTLKRLGARCVRGASDTALATIDPDKLEPIDETQRIRLKRFLDTRRAVGELVLEELRRMPDQLRLPLVNGTELLVVHESPAGHGAELSHDLSDEELLALIADDPADIVVCGASHVPFERSLDGVHVVNVGSVGEALGGRIAHYTVLSPRLDGTLVEQHWVDY